MDKLEQKIFDIVLKKNGIYINELYRKIGSNRNRIITAYKNMIKNDILEQQKDETKIRLFIKKTNFDSFFTNLENNLTLISDLTGVHVKALRRLKPISKKRSEILDEIYQYDPIKKQALPHLDKIIFYIDQIFSLTSAMDCAEALDLIPGRYKHTINQNRKKCVDSAKSIVAKILQQDEQSSYVLKQYLVGGSQTLQLLSNKL